MKPLEEPKRNKVTRWIIGLLCFLVGCWQVMTQAVVYHLGNRGDVKLQVVLLGVCLIVTGVLNITGFPFSKRGAQEPVKPADESDTPPAS